MAGFFKAWFNRSFVVRDVDFEIIIVDDGSPDGTQDVIKQLQQVYGEGRIVSTIVNGSKCCSFTSYKCLRWFQ